MVRMHSLSLYQLLAIEAAGFSLLAVSSAAADFMAGDFSRLCRQGLVKMTPPL